MNIITAMVFSEGIKEICMKGVFVFPWLYAGPVKLVRELKATIFLLSGI